MIVWMTLMNESLPVVSRGHPRSSEVIIGQMVDSCTDGDSKRFVAVTLFLKMNKVWMDGWFDGFDGWMDDRRTFYTLCL